MTKYIGIDCETFLIEESIPIPALVCISTYDGKNPPKLFTCNDFDTILEEYLDDPEITLVAQNAEFDFSVFALAYSERIFKKIFNKYKDGKIICTKLNEKLIRLSEDGNTQGRGEFSLDFLAEKYLGEDITEDKKNPSSWRLRYSELDGIPISDYPREAVSYAKEDARIVFDVYRKQMEWGDIFSDLSLQCFVGWITRIITAGGLCIDGLYLGERLKHFESIISGQREALVDCEFLVRKFKTKEPENLKKDTKAIKEVLKDLYEENKLTIPLTDKGSVKTDKDTLKKVEGKHPGIDALIAVGVSEKVVSTYLKPWSGKDFIYPQYDIIKSTGRMSSFRPNIQNVPRGGNVRGCIVPRDGTVFCAIDYSQLELCALAQVIKEHLPKTEPTLLNAINEGKDLHCLTASTILGITYEEFMEKKDELKDYRQMAKAANFGLPGGLGARTFIDYARTSYGVTLTEEEVATVISSYFTTFPDVRAYLDNMKAFKANDNTHYRCEQLYTDRVRVVPEDKYCSAANTFFQGLASDGVKQALADVTEYCWFINPACDPVAIIHDEIIFEIVENEDLSRNALILSSYMVKSMEKWMPDVKKIKAEPALMRRWEKDAEPVYDEDGGLEIWNQK